jgi:tetratricopeptide (TPR) repeat protein
MKCFGVRFGFPLPAARAMVLVCCVLAFLGGSLRSATAEDPKPANTNSEDVIRGLLQLQEQLHAAQLAIERNRQDSDAAAARNSELLTTRLQAIEQNLTGQRARELDALQSSNRLVLAAGAGFAVLGLLTLLGMAFFQARTVSRLAEISAGVPAVRALGPGSLAPATLQSHEAGLNTADLSNLRLLESLARVEKRLWELEQASHAKPTQALPAHDAAATPETGTTNPSPTAGPSGNGAETESPAWVGKGKSLLNTGRLEEALTCFDHVLEHHPSHPEALLGKGTTLEKLGRLEEAITCYDGLIALDQSMTLAYLCKAGLLNRLERYNEALDCYELALRSQEARTAAAA